MSIMRYLQHLKEGISLHDIVYYTHFRKNCKIGNGKNCKIRGRIRRIVV